MKFCFFLFNFFIFSFAFAEMHLSWGKTDGTLRNFRSFYDIRENKHLNHIGIDRCHVSGSGQFGSESIKLLKPYISSKTHCIDKIIVVDLRLESHGFVNTSPLAWKIKYNKANLGKTVDEIMQDEQKRLQELLQKREVENFPVYFIATEKELAEANGFQYVRLPILDHSRPSEEIVDIFLKLLKENSNSWFHFHCAVGKGRTTVFMAMADMVYNAKDVSFEEILNRHKKIGGQDFQKYLRHPNKDPYKQTLFLDRLAFLKRFYQFCHDQDLKTISWKEYASS